MGLQRLPGNDIHVYWPIVLLLKHSVEDGTGNTQVLLFGLPPLIYWYGYKSFVTLVKWTLMTAAMMLLEYQFSAIFSRKSYLKGLPDKKWPLLQHIISCPICQHDSDR